MNIHPHGGQSRGDASIDPIRHKLEAITEEQAITLKNVSGSPVVTEATDFNVGIYLADGAIANMGPKVMPPVSSSCAQEPVQAMRRPS